MELGSIERGTRSGVSYDPLSTDFVFRMAGAAIDLVDYGNGEYRAKIEGAFVRIKKLTAADQSRDQIPFRTEHCLPSR